MCKIFLNIACKKKFSERIMRNYKLHDILWTEAWLVVVQQTNKESVVSVEYWFILRTVRKCF